mgnify:CR=1 FL=1
MVGFQWRNKAISTRCLGHNFRSRLEARWALVFDALNMNWRYECEGIEAPSGKKWLPDFQLDLQGEITWVEIKPPHLSGTGGVRSKIFPHKELEMLEHMSFGLPEGERIWAVASDIPDLREPLLGQESVMIWGGAEGGRDYSYCLCVCPACLVAGVEFDGRSARINCDCSHEEKKAAGDPRNHVEHGDKNYTADHPAVLQAYAFAKERRFEYEDQENPIKQYSQILRKGLNL